MNVIIIPNRAKDKDLVVTQSVVSKLCSLGIIPYISREYLNDGEINNANLYDELPTSADLIIVIGGDGSMIDASQIALSLDIPLIGVNLGHVGYLSEIEPDEINILDRLIGDYRVEEKMLLVASHVSSDGLVESTSRFAVNDIVVSHGDYLGISDFRVANTSGEYIKYRADGVVISTPVGSTAYALSAGGPVVSHTLESITVTPVCPHSFFNRSIVYDSSDILSVVNDNDLCLNVSVDGRFYTKIAKGESCVVRCASRKLKIMTFEKNNTLSKLFAKIKQFE